jgi:hypothetical protein
MNRFRLGTIIVWSAAGLLMFGLIGTLGILFCYSPPALVIDPASPGRIPIYKGFGVLALAGAAFGACSYSRALYFARIPSQHASGAGDFICFAAGIPFGIILLAIVPPGSIQVHADDIRILKSLPWRIFIGAWVGLVGTAMMLVCAQFYAAMFLDD